METWWEHQNPQKSQKLNPLPERKKLSPLDCMWSFLVGCMKFVFLKRFVAIFSLG
jgi:hypothetical protein